MAKNTAFCTYFDKGFLLKALALHESFVKHNNGYKLYMLCFDDYSKEIIDKLRLKNVISISLKDFEDKKLKAVKSSRKFYEYYWTSTPSLPLYVLKINKNTKYVCYLDADLYFYSSVNTALKEIGNKSILAVEHRYPKGQEVRNKTDGRFNVGFNLFKRDKEGVACLKRWRDQCIKWCYAKREDGKFGDQLYLNEWPDRYKKLVISQNKGIDTAPWNISQYKVTRRNKDIYIDSDKLVVYHFHQFELSADGKHEYTFGYKLQPEVEKYIYKPYAKSLDRQLKKIKSIDKNFGVKNKKRKVTSKIKSKALKTFGPVYWKLKSKI